MTFYNLFVFLFRGYDRNSKIWTEAFRSLKRNAEAKCFVEAKRFQILLPWKRNAWTNSGGRSSSIPVQYRPPRRLSTKLSRLELVVQSTRSLGVHLSSEVVSDDVAWRKSPYM